MVISPYETPTHILTLTHLGCFENGNKKIEKHFKAGKIDGNFTACYENGVKRRKDISRTGRKMVFLLLGILMGSSRTKYFTKMEYSNNSEAEVKESNLYNLKSVNSKLFTLLLIFTLFHSPAYAKSFGD